MLRNLFSTNDRIIVAALMCLGLAGCQFSVPTTAVTGMVMVDGEPVESGVISFEPEEPSEPSATAEIHDGQFSIKSPRGNRRISIMAYRQASGPGPDGESYLEQFLPAKFNLKSDRFLEVEATPMFDQVIEITLAEKTPE